MITISRILALIILLSAILTPSQSVNRQVEDWQSQALAQAATNRELRVFLPEAPQFLRKIISPGPVILNIVEIINRIFREPICELRDSYNVQAACGLKVEDPTTPDNVCTVSWKCTDPPGGGANDSSRQAPCVLYEARSSSLQAAGTVRGLGKISIDLDDYNVPAIIFELKNRSGELCGREVCHTFPSGQPGGERGMNCSFTTASPLTSGTVDTAYSTSLETSTVRFAPTAVSCSVTSGSVPTGTSLSNSLPNCTLSGTPSAAGAYAFTAQAVFTPSSITCSKSYAVTIAEAARSCSFTTTSPLPSGNVNMDYSLNLEITATGFTPTAISCSVTAGSPPSNVTVTNVLPNCFLSGYPSAAGNFDFTVQAVFTPSATCAQSYSVTIST